MQVVPEHLIKDALVVIGIEGEVAVEGEGQGEGEEDGSSCDRPFPAILLCEFPLHPSYGVRWQTNYRAYAARREFPGRCAASKYLCWGASFTSKCWCDSLGLESLPECL